MNRASSGCRTEAKWGASQHLSASRRDIYLSSCSFDVVSHTQVRAVREQKVECRIVGGPGGEAQKAADSVGPLV
jgi:hypothetical protein